MTANAKCLIVQPIHASGLARLADEGIEPLLCPTPDMQDVARCVPDCVAAITRDAGFSSAAFAAAPKLRIVAVHGAGHDAVDKPAAARNGVTICNAPGANAQSVSELAFGLALAAARRITAADRAERAGLPGFRERERFVELAGKTALIVGWGETGRRLGRMLHAALGMRILVHSPRVVDIGGFERASSLYEGLEQADLVSLHTPLRPETANLLDAAAFARFRRGAILVNTARAGLVDEAGLSDALNAGHVGAAALDVYGKGAPSGPLAASERVIFTPHLGGTTEEALERVALRAAEAVVAFLAGRAPADIVYAPEKEMA